MVWMEFFVFNETTCMANNASTFEFEEIVERAQSTETEPTLKALSHFFSLASPFGHKTQKLMIYLSNSNISGLSQTRCFMRSCIAVMTDCALSSAPCLELFSAAPAKHTEN